MIKMLLKYSYYIISFLFIIGFILVVVVKDYLSNQFYITLICYYFWYIFGLYSGVFLVRIINVNYMKILRKEEREKKKIK
jgi:pilus assembly protein TadC